MKFCTKLIVFTVIIVCQFLLIKIVNSQELNSLTYTITKGLHKFNKQKQFGESVNNADLYKRKNDFKLFKSAGIKLGYTTNEYGWHHPFPFISQNFHDDPGLGTGWLGVYLEGLCSNYIATIIDAAYRSRQLDLEYDLYDGNGNVISTDKTKSTFNIGSFCLTEKFKFTKYSNESEFSAYVFAGIRYNIITSAKLDIQLANTMSGYNSGVFGLNSGLGLSYGKKVRVSCDFYYAPDFSNTYSTESGYYKNTEFGIVLGIGYNSF